MLENLKVEDIMSEKLVTLHPKDKVARATDIFQKYKVHHVPIVIMDKLVGIVSQGDILKISKQIHRMISNYKIQGTIGFELIEDVMTSKPITGKFGDSLNSAIQIMINNRINALPIVKGDKLVGLITTFDILKYLSKNN